MTYQESLAALADPTRRAVYEALVRAPQPVGVLAKGAGVSRPAVSQHLKVLREAGLVAARPKGASNIYHAEKRGLEGLRRYLDGLWGDVLTAFAEEIEKGDQCDKSGHQGN